MALSVLTGDHRIDGELRATTIPQIEEALRAFPPTQVNGAYTLVEADRLVILDATGGAFDLQLMNLLTRDGWWFWLFKADAIATVTVLPAGAQTINGGASFAIADVNSMTLVFADEANTNWYASTIGAGGSIGAHTHAASDITSGSLAVARGGTGQSTVAAAINALLPAQSGQANKTLSSDGTNPIWISRKVSQTLTGATSISAASDIVLANTTSGAFTVTLPTLATACKEIYLANIGTGGNLATFDGAGSETVEGTLTFTLADGERTLIIPGPTEWLRWI